MALPPIILAKEEPIRLISPEDDAIDMDATPEDARTAYATGADPDVSRLVIREEAGPVWFTVRALNPRDMRIFRSRIPATTGEDAIGDWVYSCEVAARFAQLGLVSVDGWPGWGDVAKESLYGVQVWPLDAVGQIPERTLLWLGSVIMKLSTLDEESKKKHGSSPDSTVGTSEARTGTDAEKAQGLLTLAPTERKNAAMG